MDGEAHHAPQLDLLPTDASGKASMATHVAVKNGDWFDPGTWAGGAVPGNGALVHIPEGVSVEYDGASNARLFIVRVDGDLTFSAENGSTTRMVVDTMVTAPGSTLTVDAGAATDGTVDVVFAEGRPAAHASHYTDHSAGDGVIGRYDWDPEQLSLGLVASGAVEVHGQEVDASLQMNRGAAAGASRLTLDSPDGDPGWAIGQKIVLGGMGYNGVDANGEMRTEDEVREIVGVRYANGSVVVDLDRPLQYSHRGPVDPATGAEITGHVGNLSRNVTFASAVADMDGDGLADRGVSLGEAKGALDHYVTQRGHVMFMHNDDIGVTNSAFFGLGRTDKSTDVDDYQLGGAGNHRLHEDAGTQGVYEPGIDMAMETPADEIANQRGRYAIHIHQAGSDGGHEHDAAESEGVMGPCPMTGDAVCHCADQDGDGIADHDDPDYFDGAFLEGNVIWGSPGWGVVQHDSRAMLKGNVAFDVAGSAYVAEIGNETGRWEGNLAVGTYGADDRPNGDDASDFNEDSGYEGNAFYLKSRVIEVVDNVAHSSARSGFYYHNHGIEFADTPTDALDGLAIGDGADSVATEDVPIRTFEGNEVFAAKQGIRIVTDPLDAVRKFNDAWSHLKDFTAVNVDESGVSVTYSSKYVFENFTIIGTADKVTADAQQASAGYFFKASAADLTVVGGHIENFGNAAMNWSMIGDRQEYRRGYWDPKDPTPDSPDTPDYHGMGAVEGIDNPAWNLWNTNIVGVSTANIDGVRWRMPGMEVETSPGVFKTMSGAKVLGSTAQAPNAPGVEIELLADSRDGGLVALWREGLANARDQGPVLAREIPLAYQETEYLSQLWFEDGSHVRRRNFEEATPGLNADIWSGTALEFAKTDSLGRQVFMYGDFSPLDPSARELTATTNEKILFTREMVDGVLARDGYMRVGGIDDVRFVVMRMAFTDRLTGEIETKKFLLALDRAWQIPAGARDNGVLLITDDMIVAPEYRVFQNGVLVAARAPIVFDEATGLEIGRAAGESGLYTTDGRDALTLGSGNDKVRGGEGDDRVLGMSGDDSIDGGGGNDELFGGYGIDLLSGGAGDDVLRGEGDADLLSGDDGNDVLSGGAGADVLKGGNGDDLLLGEDGSDRLEGGAGNDTLQGGASDDWLEGGAGKDVLRGDAGSDMLFGSDGADSLFGGDDADVLAGGNDADLLLGDGGADRLEGEAGDDTLLGGASDDSLDGGAGNDVLRGETGNDLLFGGDGGDSLFGGDGHDMLAGGAGNDLLLGDAGSDRLDGGIGQDTLLGGTSDDSLEGGAGKDVLQGESGNDLLFGGDDADSLSGGDGDDMLMGGNGDDQLLGDAGSDRLDGGAGQDTLLGGASDDSLEGGAGDDVLRGEAGNDLIFGGDGSDSLSGGDGHDMLAGGTGNDLLLGDAGADRLDGGAGQDTLLGGASDDSLEGGAGDDLLNGEEGQDDLRGGDGRDTLLGSYGDDSLFGGAGDDSLLGQFDNDVLHGGDGNDLLDGGDGNDRLFGGAGADRLVGGAGIDTADYSDAAGRVYVRLYDNVTDYGGVFAGARGDSFVSVENLVGSAGGDYLLGDAAANRLEGGAGDDYLHGQAGDDVLVGGAGADRLIGGAGIDTADYSGAAGRVYVRLYDNVTDSGGSFAGARGDSLFGVENLIGGAADDYLMGDDGANRLEGGAGDDYLHGQAGDDVLVGGAGADRLIGGEGIDTADYSGADGRVYVRLYDNVTDSGGSFAGARGDSLSGIENLVGGAADDFLLGDAAANRLEGGAGDDYLSGMEGNDVLVGGAGADRLIGGAGSDTADYSGESERVYVRLYDNVTDSGKSFAGARGDSLSGIENLTGGSANDFLLGDAAANRLEGGAGDDYLNGMEGNDVLVGGAGADRLIGGAGNDTADYTGTGESVYIRLYDNVTDYNGAYAGARGDSLSGIENLTGGSAGDYLLGDAGVNRLEGGAGDDYLNGMEGNDVLVGGAGADRLIGGAGIDTADYGDSTEGVYVRLYDNVTDYRGVFAGARGDALSGIENLVGGSAGDYLLGDDGVNRLVGGAGDDYLHGQAGNDVLVGGAGADRLIGGTGIDTADYSGESGRVYIRLYDNVTDHSGAFAGARGDALFDIENLIGGSAGDYLLGDAGANRLEGGAGDDYLHGQAGDDVLVGGAGADRLLGGTGFDTADYSGATEGVYVRLYDNATDHNGAFAGARGDWLSGIENLIGGAVGDYLLGDDGMNRLDGRAGDDYLDGRAGDDVLVGGAGDDRLIGGWGEDRLSGGAGNDLLQGGDGADVLQGSAGNDDLQGGASRDVLDGGEGDDRLEGGADSDRLVGGAGRDRFVFDERSGVDVITDFEDGVDAIEFLISSFGFDELEIAQDGGDAVLSYSGGTIRLLDTDARDLDQADFHFHSTG